MNHKPKIIIIVLLPLAILLVGCGTESPVYHSEFVTFASVSYKPKPKSEKILLNTGKFERPLKEIGLIKVITHRNTSSHFIDKVIIIKARQIGADAVMNIYWTILMPKGLGAVKLPIVQKVTEGTAVVFTPQETP